MNKVYKVIGLMSGTSLDGLDIGYVEFQNINNKWKYDIKCAETINYNKFWEDKLRTAPEISGLLLKKLDNEYGNFLGDATKKFIIKYKISPEIISSHGHTIFHDPSQSLTLQIGSGASIASVVELPVVCDFRSVDVAFGGQGAPLVPIGDKLLFPQYTHCINLGGVANISCDINKNRIAFDICPVNIVLNYYAEKIQKKFDNKGLTAKSGKVNNDLLNELNNLKYYKTDFPKSLGREWVENEFFPISEKYNLSIKDILATITEHIAHQINNSLFNYPEYNILITGGGVYNEFLIERIKSISSKNIIIPDDNTINFKEALIFGFLGLLRYLNEINCLKTVTGAIKNNIGGAIYNGKSTI